MQVKSYFFEHQIYINCKVCFPKKVQNGSSEQTKEDPTIRLVPCCQGAVTTNGF